MTEPCFQPALGSKASVPSTNGVSLSLPTPPLPGACLRPLVPPSTAGAASPHAAAQDHGGALGPEEFKACLISLGYDVENDRQVPSLAAPRPQTPLTSLLSFFLPIPWSPSPSTLLRPRPCWISPCDLPPLLTAKNAFFN